MSVLSVGLLSSSKQDQLVTVVFCFGADGEILYIAFIYISTQKNESCTKLIKDVFK